VQFSRRPDLRLHVAFLEDYDIDVARVLYQGCDVWLNTPRRPLEACGTSGEKAALNGALNCSVLDGWWDEQFDGQIGWAIMSAENEQDIGLRDHLEANSTFDLLERQIVPLFYDRAPGRPPAGWLRRVRTSLRTLGPVVPASRMVREYVERLYEPAGVRADVLGADHHARARALAAWKERVLARWGDVRIPEVDSDDGVTDLGADRAISAAVVLGQLRPEDVSVELVHGPVGPNDELASPVVTPMRHVAVEDGRHRYEGSFVCERSGRYGYTVRVVPAHPDLASPAELARVTWA
jgi:starch phosphorylase